MTDDPTCMNDSLVPDGSVRPCGGVAFGLLDDSPRCFYHLYLHTMQTQRPQDIRPLPVATAKKKTDAD